MKRASINLLIIIVNYIICNWFIFELFFNSNSDKAFWKGLLYILIAIVLCWFIIDIWRGLETADQFNTCMMHLISLAGMFLLFGLSMLYIVKNHPVLYIVLYNGLTWNIGLIELLKKLLNYARR